MMLEAAPLLFFPVLMVFAAVSDLLTMTISNRISIALAVLFIAMAFACGLPATQILWHLTAGAAVLVFAFGLFAMGWIGGGDAKLAAATAIWLGFDRLGDYAISASLLGGVLTISIIALRKLPLPGVLLARQWASRLHEPGTGIPYGIALATAGLMLYPETAIWLGFAATHH
ncbi:MAG: A24 family peptidase [Methylocella sp.]